jgi:hypothetical protein
MAFRTTDILIWASKPGRIPIWSAREPVMRIRRGRPDSGETAVFFLNGLLLAVGLQLEQRKRWLQHSAGGTTDVPGRWRGGNGNGRQLRASLWSDVVQVRTARGRQGTAKGYELYGSGHESTGLGYVGKRRTSLEGYGKTDANRFSRDPRGKPMWMRSCAICKALLHKFQLCESVRCQCGWVW